MSHNCTTCGENLDEHLREVCYTLTHQGVTLTDEDGIVEWDACIPFVEDQKECYLECDNCLFPLTLKQNLHYQRRVYGFTPVLTVVSPSTPICAKSAG